MYAEPNQYEWRVYLGVPESDSPGPGQNEGRNVQVLRPTFQCRSITLRVHIENENDIYQYRSGITGKRFFEESKVTGICFWGGEYIFTGETFSAKTVVRPTE